MKKGATFTSIRYWTLRTELDKSAYCDPSFVDPVWLLRCRSVVESQCFLVIPNKCCSAWLYHRNPWRYLCRPCIIAYNICRRNKTVYSCKLTDAANGAYAARSARSASVESAGITVKARSRLSGKSRARWGRWTGEIMVILHPWE